MGKVHHLVAKLAEDLYKLLKGAHAFQMLQRHQDLAQERNNYIIITLSVYVCCYTACFQTSVARRIIIATMVMLYFGIFYYV